MRNFYVAIVGLLFLACSVDNDEIDVNNELNLSVDLASLNDECISDHPWELFDKGTNFGEVTINSDEDYIYISFLAQDEFRITGIRWDIGTSWDEIPHNNGGIIPGQLSNNIKFRSGVKVYEEVMSRSNFECVYLTARVELKNSLNRTFNVWLGNHLAGQNNSKYLWSCLCQPQDDPICIISAGSNKEKTISRDYVRANLKYSWQVEEFLLDMLDEGVPRTGTFSPTIDELIVLYRQNVFQTFVTTYTITDGDCSSSSDLSVTIGAYHDYQL